MRRWADCGSTCPDLRHGPDRRDRERGRTGIRRIFFKDAIIEAVQLSKTPGAGFAWLAVTACVFVTAFYTFPVFYAFHGKERFEPHDHAPHESPAVVTVPLVSLPFPRSARAGSSARAVRRLFRRLDFDLSDASGSARDGGGVPRCGAMMLHAVSTLRFGCPLRESRRGYLYLLKPELHAKLPAKSRRPRHHPRGEIRPRPLLRLVLAGGVRRFGNGLWRFGDVTVIDGLM